ncbi:hypothetical protein EDD69_10518 [Thermolongibacillus altinsuensis]|uniref:Uncharacterized protein n=1 Tax=Thermolongibacillus altinsuensis TaxID=575256 RepID=A0A4R1QFL6_9BACL|nr:hypothetical protein EDD69_10518 [Thermolongibacillus altinsuensis]
MKRLLMDGTCINHGQEFFIVSTNDKEKGE